MKKQLISLLYICVLVSCADALTEYDSVNVSEEVQKTSMEEIIPMTKSVEDVQDMSYMDSSYPYTREEDSLYIESLGWKIDRMYEDSLYYLVNGELLFVKADLMTDRNTVQGRMYGHMIDINTQHLLLNVNQTNNHSVSIPSHFTDAIAEWNSLEGCNIYFAISSQYAYDTSGWWNVNVEIGPDHIYNSDLAEELEFGIMIVYSSSQEDNVPANYLYINPDHDNYKNLTDSQKKHAIMHALGHVIKLHNADESETWIGGSWNEKTYTIMNKSYFMDDMYFCNGFSDFDRDDLAAIYPVVKSVVHGVTLKETYDPQLPAGKLKQYKAYDFSSELITPKRGDEEFYCEYEINGPVEGYSITSVNDTTVRISFNTTGTYRVTSILKSDEISGLELVSNTVVYEVINNELYHPEVEDITLNRPFELQWVYADENYPDAEIVVTGVEYFFGDGASNIDIDEVFNGKVSVTLSEYGCYRINMKAVTPSGQILKIRRFLVDEYWRPGMWAAQDGTEFPFSPKFFEKRHDKISERPMESRIVSNGPGEYVITIGGSLTLQHNFYAELYMSYLRQYEELLHTERRLDVRLVTEDAPFDYIMRNAGSSNVTYGPLRPVIIMGLSGSCGVPEYAYANYYGHETVVVPEDAIRVE